MIVNKMNDRTVETVSELERAIFSDPWRKEDFEESLSNPNRAFFTVEEPEGAVLGYCGVQWAGDQADILNLGVAPEARRRGIAEALLCKAIDAAIAAGVRAVFLEVRAHNLPAIALYEKTGFQKIGVRADYYADPREDAVLYCLEVGS